MDSSSNCSCCETTRRDFTAESAVFSQKMELNKQVISNMLAKVLSEQDVILGDIAAAEHACRESVCSLQNSIQCLQQERAQADGDQQQLERLNTKLKQIMAALQHKEAKRYAEQQRLDTLHTDVDNKKKVLDDILAHNKELKSTAGQSVELFRQNLGLDITKSSLGTTTFSFTQIKRHEPERVFSVWVSLEANQYRLATEPSVPDLARLQDILNRTNNLPGFLAHVRKLFKGIP